MKKNKHILLGTALIVVGLFFLLIKPSAKTQIAIESEKTIQAVYGIGTLIAQNEYRLQFGVPATIDVRFVSLGQNVTKGQKLLGISGVGIIYSPIKGNVVELPFSAGENVPPQVVVVKVSDSSDLYLQVELEQEVIASVKKGQKVTSRFDALPDQTYDGIVESVFSNGGKFYVKISLPKKIESALPGMTADVGIITSEERNSLVIPTWANKNKGQFKIKTKDGREFSNQFETKDLGNGKTEIIGSDITAGDFIIVD